MQEDYFESIHPPDLIHFDGRTTPDSACSSLSSPRSSPVPREMQDDVISPITSRTVVLVPMNSTTPLPFDEDVPRKEQEDLKIDVLSQQYEEEEEEPGRIMNCASPRRKDPQLNVANVEIEEKKSETQSPFDEKRRTMDFFTPSYPRDDFEELPLVPTDEKMSVPQKNPRLMDAGLLQLPETEQIGDLNGDTVSSNCNKSGSFDDERFENPSFTPDKQVDYASTSMFQSLANATISAALHIENLIIGPSEQPRTPEQPSWYAENNGARDEIFESMASPADKIKQPSQDGTPNTSRVWVEAESPADVWWSEKDRIDKRNSSVRSPDVSMECTPVISSTVVRRSFGAETLTTAFEEDAPADETGRALSGNFDTPVSLNAPADELRAPLPRRGVDPPPSLVQDAPGDKAEVPPEREIGDIERANIAPNSSNSIVQNSRRSASPHLDTSRKISDPQKVKPHSIQIDDQPLDERRQDKSSPISINGKEETPDDEPAALVPKKVLSPAESALDAIRIDFQKTSSTSEHIIFPGKAHDIGEEHPELKLAVESASPILRASSPLPIAANTKSPQDSDTENGYASDGTDNLLGSLHMLMNDLDNMAQKRGIRTKADQSASFQSCVSTVPEGLLNSSLLSTSGFATPSKAESDVLRDGLPLRINMLNNDLGIAMGDVIISLLHNEDDNKTWVARVNEAVWRCRIVRRNCDTRWLKGKLKKHRDSPSPGRSSVFVDSDDGRVVGKTVQEIQVAAIQHLKYDELSDALELYTEILEKYLSYVPVLQALPDSNYKLGQLGVYIGIAKYDLGIINMLQGEFGIARGLFEEAATMLSVETSIDQWTIQNKIATCLIAQQRFKEAHVILREVYQFARERTSTLPDRRQCAEILNNLACMNYILNDYKEAFAALSQSLDIQLSLSDDALYLGSKFSSQSSAMNVAVVRANVGFLALVARDIPTARIAFESSLKTQALLLRDAHVSLVSAMEHLAIIHLFDDSKDKALQLLRRLLHMQIDAFGANDHRCLLSRRKIKLIEDENSEERLTAALEVVPNMSEEDKPTKEASQEGKTMTSFWASLNPVPHAPTSERVPI